MIYKILGSNVRSDFKARTQCRSNVIHRFHRFHRTNLRNLWMKLDSIARLLVGFGASDTLEANLFW